MLNRFQVMSGLLDHIFWAKLTLLGIYISVKQIPSHVRSLGPHSWAKLTLLGIYISVKQIPSYVKSLKPHTWAKVNTL